MSERKTIAIDLDDVLAAHVESFVEFSNSNYGTNLLVDDYSDHWSDVWQVEEEEINRRALEFHKPARVMAFEIKKQSQITVKRLGEHHDLFIVTARPEYLLDTTREWISTHFPHTFKEVHFVPIWIPNNTVTKAQICAEIGAQYLIDDLPRHCNLVAEAGRTAILFGNYGWNRREEIHENVIRCSDWQAVLTYFGV